ncbi:poly(ADP-ribose) glycohydrolase isoform X2 [Bacillus rossius redtenbacheri]|uniref:poly(ADP-ribose) glycohydrolase isoform X2 n=2 Tax=Bacillus rossius redtenbacheri TaxID=93214 RepID=UPI002FDCB371
MCLSFNASTILNIDMEDKTENYRGKNLQKDYEFTEPMSEDMFEDDFPMLEEGASQSSSKSNAVSKDGDGDLAEEELGSWRGQRLSDLPNRHCPALPPVAPSASHTVLFELPVQSGCLPRPHPPRLKDKWDSNHVRMPCSPMSMYPVQNDGADGKAESLRPRWDIIEEALLKPITSSHQLQEAIFSYNARYDFWDFSTLHSFCTEYLSSTESARFFTVLLPMVVQLALRLPALVTGGVPLLAQHAGRAVSLSQQQVACLLANAFLCTFPRRNSSRRSSEYSSYPDINFSRLFCSARKNSTCCLEKLQCIVHYFWRVCTKMPEGVVTFSRQYVSQARLPAWAGSRSLLPLLHVSSTGTIEDEGGGCLQVDFANKKVGGGVLGAGCVQEEIRFVICPELLAARLFTQELDSTEALVVVGCERYSSYTGYGDTFKWAGDYVDSTPRDSSGRRSCAIVAMDALLLDAARSQFAPSCMQRELNKAYAGFHSPELPAGRLCPVATGNWGCGAFRGDTRLKALLQLMAAGEAGRHLAYFTFGDTGLRDDVFELHALLAKHGVTVGELWKMLVQYHERSRGDGEMLQNLYPYLRKTVARRASAAGSAQARRSPSGSAKPGHAVRTVAQSPSCEASKRSSPSQGKPWPRQKLLSTDDLEALSVFVQDEAVAAGGGTAEEGNTPESKRAGRKERRGQEGRLLSFLDDCDKKAQTTIVDYFRPK